MDTRTQDVARAYRKKWGLSLRVCAEHLTEKIVNTSLSGQAYAKWENDPNVAPDLYLILNIFTTYTDDRRMFAVDFLKAIMPHVFDSGMVTFHLPKVE